jgi:Protein of unknown function (DUF4232)
MTRGYPWRSGRAAAVNVDVVERQARRRRRQRRAAAGAAVAALAALGTGVAAARLAGSGAPRTDGLSARPGGALTSGVSTGVIAWSPRAAGPAPISSPSTPPSSNGPCRASKLGVSHGEGARFGRALEQVVLTNTSTETCTLPGTVQVIAARDAHGRAVPLTARATTHGVVLGPGQRALITLSAAGSCTAVGTPGHDVIVRRLELLVGAFSEVTDADFNVACGDVQMIGPVALADEDTAVTPSGPWDITIDDVPAAIAPGDELTYTVTLTNKSSTTQSLDPCPSYTEYFTAIGGAEPQVHSERYALSCADVAPVAPGASVAFAMRIIVPATDATGMAKMSWQLDDGTAAGDASVVQPGP